MASSPITTTMLPSSHRGFTPWVEWWPGFGSERHGSGSGMGRCAPGPYGQTLLLPTEVLWNACKGFNPPYGIILASTQRSESGGPIFGSQRNWLPPGNLGQTEMAGCRGHPWKGMVPAAPGNKFLSALLLRIPAPRPVYGSGTVVCLRSPSGTGLGRPVWRFALAQRC